jgi:hypothetical protein
MWNNVAEQFGLDDGVTPETLDGAEPPTGPEPG